MGVQATAAIMSAPYYHAAKHRMSAIKANVDYDNKFN